MANAIKISIFFGNPSLITNMYIFHRPIATFVRGPIATIVTSPGNCFVILVIASQASSSGKIMSCILYSYFGLFKPSCLLYPKSSSTCFLHLGLFQPFCVLCYFTFDSACIRRVWEDDIVEPIRSVVELFVVISNNECLFCTPTNYSRY